MKSILLACGIICSAGVADAATYKFRFKSEPLVATQDCQYNQSGDPDYCERGAGRILSVEFVFALPDLVSRTIDFQGSWDHPFVGSLGYPFKICEDIAGESRAYCRYGSYPFLDSGNGPSESLPEIMEYGTISTDAKGDLASISWNSLSDWPDYYATLTSGGWGDSSKVFFEAPGTWTVSQVPLPAGGALLLSAIALLHLSRRRRS